MTGARIALLVALAACGSKGGAKPIEKDARAEAPRDAGEADAMPHGEAAWDALSALPAARPRWRVDVPRFDGLSAERGLFGPLHADGVAIVGGEAIGIAAVDVDGRLVLHRPDPRIDAPPVVFGDDAMLSVGECLQDLAVARGDKILGCYAVLAVRGQAAYGAGSIVMTATDVPDGAAVGQRELRLDGRRAYLGRDDDWVAFDLADPPRGEVRATRVGRRDVPHPPDAPRVRSSVNGFPVDAWADDDALDLRYHDPDVLAPRAAVARIAVAPGSVWEAPGGGAVRAFSLGNGVASVQPVEVPLDQLIPQPIGAALPGIALLDVAHDDATNTFAAAIRLDSTLTHDYIAAFTADGGLGWVWRLPPPPGGGRALPTGVLIKKDGVVVFHDGSAVTALPPP